MNKLSHPYRLLREPLLHFLIIGAGLFFLFNQIGNPVIDKDNKIIISKTDIDVLAKIWLRKNGRPPSAKEQEQQLKYYIREQVLYREAMAMGLDKNDVIVRRRLAKKMKYLFDDLNFIPKPEEAELELYLAENREKFTRSAAITFSQIYLSPEHRAKNISGDAKKLLVELNNSSKDLPAMNEVMKMGDRSLLPFKFNNTRKKQINNMFGADFSEQLFSIPADNLKDNRWQGPFKSGYGLHLVYVHSRTDSREYPLDDIRERVAKAWRITKQHEANEVFYQSLRQRYEIMLDDEPALSASMVMNK
ncbi:hypothetical protein MNBD_GAMMA25-1516 [hydrothermal vent metagenome]|uniref:PpiC domain-containing protein n=1 Tax=hydrothermal vent metagenome TaxID=652676 RepID=A0A3B1AT15_9ZZZZ